MKPLLITLAISMSACEVESASPTAITFEERGEYGALAFELSAPGPITEGRNDLRINVFRGDSPVSDARLSLVAWMPSMRHEHAEASCEPEDVGYSVEDLTFSMPGLWKIEVEADAGDVSDLAEFTVEVR